MNEETSITEIPIETETEVITVLNGFETDETVSETTVTVSYEDIVESLEQIEKNQTTTNEILLQINEQELQTTTATIYIFGLLAIVVIYTFIKSCINF